LMCKEEQMMILAMFSESHKRRKKYWT